MKVLTNMNAPFMEYVGEKCTGVSLTVPDQALTPQELLRKFANGTPFGLNSNIVYDSDHGDLDLPEFDKMDKLDRLHAMQENSFNVKELYEDFDDLRKKAKANDAKKRSEAERNMRNGAAANEVNPKSNDVV